MSPRTLTARITRLAVGGLLAALLLAGVGTGALLHARARQALDRALLAAAWGEAHPWSEERWSNDRAPSPVAVRLWVDGDPEVPAADVERAMAEETPIWLDVGARRVLALVVEPQEVALAADEDHPHQVVVASAQAVRLSDTALPFALAWAAMSAGVAGGVSVLLGRLIRDATAPLTETAARLASLPGRPRGERLPPVGLAEIDAVVEATNTLLGRLEHAFEAQSRFTAEAAHELRTPVAAMLGELELALRRDREATSYREALTRLREDARRLSERVEALMALARIDAGQAEATREREHVSSLLLAARRAERRALEDARVTVEQRVDDDPEVAVHVGLLTLALGNLLRNVAVHAPGATVRLRTERVGDRVRLCVDDDGPGVPEGSEDAVLGRFARADRRRDGLGLGLSLAVEIARRHGGELALSRSPEGGCRAALTLPCA